MATWEPTQGHLQKLSENLSSQITPTKPRNCSGHNSGKAFVLQDVRNNPLKQYYSCAASHTSTLADQELWILHTAATPPPSCQFINRHTTQSQLHCRETFGSSRPKQASPQHTDYNSRCFLSRFPN